MEDDSQHHGHAPHPQQQQQETTTKRRRKSQSSVALTSILRRAASQATQHDDDSEAVQDSFWKHVWQTQCAYFPATTPSGSSTTQSNPLKALVEHGWEALLHLLNTVSHASPPTPTPKQTHTAAISSTTVGSTLPRGIDIPPPQPSPPRSPSTNYNNNVLLFRNCQVLTADEQSVYSRKNNNHEDGSTATTTVNVWAAYLDGCSIVINHADTYSPWIAALCNDLQCSAGLPHVYANTYLTPPGGIQTAQPHSDDRDVFIVQVVGQKAWSVYQTVPVPYPYSAEQVGKDVGIPTVPAHVLQGPKIFDHLVLSPGDVLYLPRGYVHEATTLPAPTITPETSTSNHHNLEPSFHVTLAIATHDWTLAGMLGKELIPAVLEQVMDYRKAMVPPPLDPTSLQTTLNSIFAQLQSQITATVVQEHLQGKINVHNQRASWMRQALFDEEAKKGITVPNTATSASSLVMPSQQPTSPYSSAIPAVVGCEAAQSLTLTSQLRPATAEERACVIRPAGSAGLHVRDEVADAVTEIIGRLKTMPKSTATSTTQWPCIQDWPTAFLLPNGMVPPPTLCPLTLLSVAKLCVELGALAVVVVE